MSFNTANFNKVAQDFRQRRERAVAESEDRKAEVYTRIPELREIDREISSVGARVFAAAVKGGNVPEAVEKMRKENFALRGKRAELLVSHGYPADYTEIHYQCEQCLDMGFRGINMCSCMRRELILAGYESSGLGNLLNTQTFDTFDLSYYQGAEREKMERNVEILRDYATHFGTRASENYLLVGSTGLGKTHLSTAVAKEVLDGGYDVVYVTAEDMFSEMETVHFHNGGREETDHYLQCDLLIIDDLGTELTNSFTVSCLYIILNSRINTKRATVLNTNLTSSELRERYADRVTSRMFGEFAPLVFVGRDIRLQKLSKKKSNPQ